MYWLEFTVGLSEEWRQPVIPLWKEGEFFLIKLNQKNDFELKRQDFKIPLNPSKNQNHKSGIEKCGITFQGNTCLHIKSIEL